MAIWLNKDSKVIVQGMTGATGMKRAKLMLGDGTNVVGGVNPRKAGQTVDFDGTEVPVFGTVKEAIEAAGANVSADLRAGEVHQGRGRRGHRRRDPAGRRDHRGHRRARHGVLMGVRQQKGNKTRIIGPNCPGIITPGQSNISIIPGDITKPGRMGLDLEVRHADVPDDVRAARHRLLDLCRHRR
ncbi:Succinate--CoA ligase [ADP-forming] subunit alpha OS=Streptomyces glaucescens OX=1907 GN=sucD PE=3 SV=1 [Streptomyces glaucescens]